MSNTGQKVAVITGASQGIGAGLVEAYRKQGWAVVATSRTIAESQDDQILTVQGDIADRATAERVIAAGLERFGRIDTLVNNAGIFLSKEFIDFTEADYDAVLGVNVAGFFRISQLAVEQMLKQGGGHIVQITTSLVEHPNSNVPPCRPRSPRVVSRPPPRPWPSSTRPGTFAPTRWPSARSKPPCTRRNTTRPSLVCTPSVAWVRSATSPMRCSTWRTLPSSPGPSCPSTVARRQGTDHRNPSSDAPSRCDLLALTRSPRDLYPSGDDGDAPYGRTCAPHPALLPQPPAVGARMRMSELGAAGMHGASPLGGQHPRQRLSNPPLSTDRRCRSAAS